MVEATVSYLAEMTERPAFYLFEPPAGIPWRNTKGDRRAVTIHDARDLGAAPTLDREGFCLVRFETAVENLHEASAIRERYYREVEQLVQRVCGAARVLAFDHNLRNASVSGRARDGIQGPVRYAHNDY